MICLIVLAGGTTKLYRRISPLNGTGLDPKANDSLTQSDSSSTKTNRQLETLAPTFHKILDGLDKLGIDTFPSERREGCAELTEQFAEVVERLLESSSLIAEPTKLITDEKPNSFLLAGTKSDKLLFKVNTEHRNCSFSFRRIQRRQGHHRPENFVCRRDARCQPKSCS